MERARSSAWLVFALAAATVSGLFFVDPDGWAGTAAYGAVSLASALAVGAALVLHQPERRLPWALLAAGVLLFAAGDAFFDAAVLGETTGGSGLRLADVLYLAAYPFLAAALVSLCRRPGWRPVLDAAIVTAGVAAPVWIYLVEPALDDPGVSGSQLGVLIAYPLLDLLLLAATATLLMTTAARTASYRFLILAALATLVADAAYLQAVRSDGVASWAHAGWLVAFVAWGTAALHPSMRILSARARPAPGRLPLSRVAVLVLAALSTPVALVVQAARGEPIGAAELGVATVAFLLVLLRLALLVREVETLRREEEIARADADSARRLLAAQNDRLRELDRAKDEFLSLVSHELRTPLTSIVGYLELLAEGEVALDDEQRDFVEVIQRNARRLERLVDDLLFAARLEAGVESLVLATVDVGELAEEALESARPQAAAKGLDLESDVRPVPSVVGDGYRLARALDNLLSNAVKFTPEGGRVEVRVHQPDELHVAVEVADTGIGIPEAEQQQLFQRFFRASRATDDAIPGTGLGLYMVRRIVEAHGGTIGVESRPDSGTTFRIELPLEGRPQEPTEPPAVGAPARVGLAS